jgi:hypothetical protein
MSGRPGPAGRAALHDSTTMPEFESKLGGAEVTFMVDPRVGGRGHVRARTPRDG